MSDQVLSLRGITKTYNAGLPGQVDVLRGADLGLKRARWLPLSRRRGPESPPFCTLRECSTPRMLALWR